MPKLKHIVDELDPDDAVLFALITLGEYQTPEASQIITDFLDASTTDAKKAKYLTNALGAFSRATGFRMTAGAQPNSKRIEEARRASVWWKEKGSKEPLRQ